MNNNIDIIQRQTDYTIEKIKIKLKEHNNDLHKIIKEYLEISEKQEKELTTNQTIYKEIRTMFDNASHAYRLKKEEEEKKKEEEEKNKENKKL